MSDEIRFLNKAKGVTIDERRKILKNIEKGVIDNGIFKWVKCPVWRHRLYHISNSNIIDEMTLNKIFRYVLEGEKMCD